MMQSPILLLSDWDEALEHCLSNAAQHRKSVDEAFCWECTKERRHQSHPREYLCKLIWIRGKHGVRVCSCLRTEQE